LRKPNAEASLLDYAEAKPKIAKQKKNNAAIFAQAERRQNLFSMLRRSQKSRKI